MACRQCPRCGARWIEGQLYWGSGKPGQEVDLAGLVCNNANDPACLNPFKGAIGGDTWEKRAGLTDVRCLYTGGHMNRNEATRFVAQINTEQSGQFQRVYDTLPTGVSDSDNSKIETIIKQQGGCRKVMTDFVNSDPETDFKKSIQMDWAFKPIKYYDE